MHPRNTTHISTDGFSLLHTLCRRRLSLSKQVGCLDVSAPYCVVVNTAAFIFSRTKSRFNIVMRDSQKVRAQEKHKQPLIRVRATPMIKKCSQSDQKRCRRAGASGSHAHHEQMKKKRTTKKAKSSQNEYELDKKGILVDSKWPLYKTMFYKKNHKHMTQ